MSSIYLNFQIQQALPESTSVYESIGHAFFLESVQNVRNSIDKKVKSNDDKIKKLEVS
jgi:chaperonin cofactor prefoldin